MAILDQRFREDLAQFTDTCKVVRGLSRVRIGAVGARPNAFNTTRFSEKLLEARGHHRQHDRSLRGLWQRRENLDDDPRVRQRMEQIRAYADASQAPDEAILQDGQVRAGGR